MNSDIETMQSPAVQDYLRAIYQIAGYKPEGDRVTTSQLAAWLDVRPSSVTAMLQKLASASPALVDYHKSYGVSLTAEGKAIALRAVRFHRLLELYLHEIMGFELHEVHEEADRLEHAVSEVMIDRMAETLGHPARDPHGHIIPAADLSLTYAIEEPLSDLAVGDAAIVQHIPDEDPDLLRYFGEIGLKPGAAVMVTRREEPAQVSPDCEPPDGWLWLRVGGRDPLRLRTAVTERVYVAEPDT